MREVGKQKIFYLLYNRRQFLSCVKLNCHTAPSTLLLKNEQ